MGTTSNKLLEADPTATANMLGRLRSYHILAALWGWATVASLEGQALFLLAEELTIEADANAESAKMLANRIAELGGTVVADPTQMLEHVGAAEIELPRDPGNVGSILGYALHQIRQVIPEYHHLAEDLRETDPITHRLVLEIYGQLATREDEIESVLGGVE